MPNSMYVPPAFDIASKIALLLASPEHMLENKC